MEMDQLTPTLGVDELETLCKFIPSDQLLGLRQVSEVWNEAALPVLRKRRDLNTILTEDAERNRDILEYLRNLPENGFVASGMKLKFQGSLMPDEFSMDADFIPFKEVLTEICERLGTRRVVKTFVVEFQVKLERRLTSEHLLRMIGHLSTSLEILDLDECGNYFALGQETKDSMLELFRNSPLNNLKEIGPPSYYNMIGVIEEGCFWEFDKWLNIIVQSAPNLVEDPTALCRWVNEEESGEFDSDEDHWTDLDSSDEEYRNNCRDQWEHDGWSSDSDESSD